MPPACSPGMYALGRTCTCRASMRIAWAHKDVSCLGFSGMQYWHPEPVGLQQHAVLAPCSSGNHKLAPHGPVASAPCSASMLCLVQPTDGLCNRVHCSGMGCHAAAASTAGLELRPQPHTWAGAWGTGLGSSCQGLCVAAWRCTARVACWRQSCGCRS